MLGIPQAISSVSDLLNKAISTAWPSPADKAKAEAIAITSAAQAAIVQLEAAQAVMKAEATSADPWTSRARPSFLYVVYLLLLTAIPMGIVSAVSPDTALDITQGFKAWLGALPASITDLFTFVMLGYIGGRSLEKFKGVSR
ncbi:MAG: 3TM-type holin [Candidatus Binatia bacterium]